MYRDLFRIALTIASLNYLDVLACDIQNAYLTADYRERVWVIARTGFGSEAGNNMLMRNTKCDTSIKERWNTKFFYILRGKLEYVVFLPYRGFTILNCPTCIEKGKNRMLECTVGKIQQLCTLEFYFPPFQYK